MNFEEFKEEITNSATFKDVASKILSSGRTFKGNMMDTRPLKSNLHDLINKWLLQGTIDKSEFFCSDLSKRTSMKDTGFNYVMSLAMSLHNQRKLSQEVEVYARIIHDPEVNKDIARKIMKINDFVLLQKKCEKGSNFLLDDVFIDSRDIVQICEKFFNDGSIKNTDKTKLPIEILKWVKNEFQLIKQ